MPTLDDLAHFSPVYVITQHRTNPPEWSVWKQEAGKPVVGPLSMQGFGRFSDPSSAAEYLAKYLREIV